MTDERDVERWEDEGGHDGTRACPDCAGAGTRTLVMRRYWGKDAAIVACPRCGGEGRVKAPEGGR